MNTAWRDSERTFADFYWNTSESRPELPKQGLQPGLSRGHEIDDASGDVTELLFTESGWRVLSHPDSNRREVADLMSRLSVSEEKATALENLVSTIEGRLTILENRP